MGTMEERKERERLETAAAAPFPLVAANSKVRPDPPLHTRYVCYWEYRIVTGSHQHGQNTDVWHGTWWHGIYMHANRFPYSVSAATLICISEVWMDRLMGSAKKEKEEKLINTLMNIDSFINKIVNSHALPLPGGFFSVNYLRTGLQALAIFNHE